MTQPTDSMTHDEARDLLDAWREGELDEPDASKVAAHVADCERCQETERLLGGGLREVMKFHAADLDLLPGVQRRLHLRSRGKFYASGSSVGAPWPVFFGSLFVLAVLMIVYLLQVWISRP